MDGVSFENLYAAEQVAHRITSHFSTLGPKHTKILFYHRVRVKSVDSIKEKLYRKRILQKQSNYNYRDITDIVGVRIVTLKDDDLLLGFDLMNDVLRLCGTGTQPLFDLDDRWENFNKASLYHRLNNTEDETNIYQVLYDYICKKIKLDFPSYRADDKLTIANRKSAAKVIKKIYIGPADAKEYSSAHFNFDAFSYYKSKKILVPVEIQLRTASEDIWSEINHKLLYKSKNPYIWSPALENYYTELSGDSTAFKAQIEALSNIIQRFISHSDKAAKIEAAFREPTTRVHASLVFSLFYAVSEKFTTDEDNNFQKYEKLVLDMGGQFGKSKFESVISSALSIVEDIRAEVQKYLNQSEVNSTEFQLCWQRIYLINFECIRLRILSDLSNLKILEQKKSENRTESELIAKEKAMLKTSLESQFDELCSFKNNRNVKIRPVSAISYWKYLCQRRLNQDHALNYIKIAREELEYDKALPTWSIYRVLIPRRLARELVSSIKALTDKVTNGNFELGSINIGNINVSSKFVADKTLVEAFENTLTTINEVRKLDSRRGDLIYNYSDSGYCVDEDFLFYIYNLYANLFDREILDQSDEFRGAFDKVHASIKRRLRKIPENKKEFEGIRSRLHEVADAKRRLKDIDREMKKQKQEFG